MRKKFKQKGYRITKKQGYTLRLLLEGWYPNKIAKHLGVKRQAVYKHIKKLEENGIIERTNKSPAFYRKKEPIEHSKPGVQCKPNLFMPHKYGGSFTIIGNLKVKRNKNGYHTIKEPDHTIMFGNSKAVVWIKSFPGNSVNEILNNARRRLDDLATIYSNRYRIKLILNRIYEDNEWVLNDKPASKELSDKADIKKEKLIAGALFKFDDRTHPDYIEINKAPGYDQRIPTEHARTLEYLLIEAPNLLKQIVESVKVNNDKIKLIEEKIKKGEIDGIM